MIRLERNDQMAQEFFEKVWQHLKEKDSGKKEIEELFKIAKRSKSDKTRERLKQNLKSIIAASPEKIEQYVKKHPDFAEKWDFIALYNQFNSKGLSDTYRPRDFIKDLGLTVCPYCNRQYITTGKSRRIAEIDHFYPKKIKDDEKLLGKKAYPYLAMSFYNLIPACPSCNRSKSNDIINTSPYMIEDSDSYVQLNYKPLSGSFLNDKSQLEITISEKETSDDSYINRLELEKHYKYHNDYVYDLIKRKEMYDESYLKELDKIENLFSDRNEMRRVIWGNYTSKEELHKRPLAKLTRDILREIDPELLDD